LLNQQKTWVVITGVVIQLPHLNHATNNPARILCNR
jgi:hypothetical protein